MLYIVDKDIQHTIAYVSNDGGQSWSIRPARMDPEGRGGMENYRSKDGGVNWQRPVIAKYLDRPFITVDDTNSRYRGRVYINAHIPAGERRQIRIPTVRTSGGGGSNFSEIVEAPGVTWFANPGNGVVFANGTFVSVFADLANLKPKLESAQTSGWIGASRDGGAHLSEAVHISDWYYPLADRKLSYIPMIAVDRVRNTGAKASSPRWPFGYNGGDTAGIAADANGAFHVFWTDNRTGTAQVWTSVVDVSVLSR